MLYLRIQPLLEHFQKISILSNLVLVEQVFHRCKTWRCQFLKHSLSRHKKQKPLFGEYIWEYLILFLPQLLNHRLPDRKGNRLIFTAGVFGLSPTDEKYS